MAPSPIPAPLPPWVRWALRLEPFVENFLRGLLEHIGEIKPQVGETPPDEWRRLLVKFDSIATSDPADDQFISFDIVNITNSQIDNSWTDADYEAVETSFQQHYEGAAQWWANTVKLAEYKWYRMAFNAYPSPGADPSLDKPFMQSGPPVRVTTKNIPGTGVAFPPQIAIVVTERTAWPHHHGRIYHPSPPLASQDTTGRILSTSRDSLGALYQLLYQDLMAKEFFPCIPVTRVDKQPARALLGVEQVWVDNNYDTIRRRHYKAPTGVTKLPL